MLRIGNKAIITPLETILRKIREETHGKYFRDIQHKGNNLSVTCPVHKDGNERHPSCYIFIGDDVDDETDYGQVHCFTCDYTAKFPQMVGMCFDEGEEFGKEWLLERYGDVFIQEDAFLPEIEVNSKPIIVESLNSSYLDEFDYYHPYMWKRKLTREVVDKFRIGYDKKHDAITFPLWDEKNNLIGHTARSVRTKQFFIPEDIKKPIYLLNVCIFEKKTCIYICESQINALTLWTYGLPAVALIGKGSPEQYETLNHCGIRNFITCFDGDEAGDKGRARFHKYVKDCLITDIILPRGKDVNDLSKAEFFALKQQ